MQGSIKIIAGRLKGKKLKVLENMDLRPTPNRLRESLFNILQHDIKQARCLDGFAGTGALGIEAYSRGASHVTFLENHPRVFQQLLDNTKDIPANHIKILQMDCLEFLNSTHDTFDLIFLDPPFRKNYWQDLTEVILEKQLLNEHGLLYLESPEPQNINDKNWQLIRNGKVGEVYFALYEIKPKT